MEEPKSWTRLLFWLMPEWLSSRFKTRQQQVARAEFEQDRLDRLRNPSKYLGKQD